MDSIWPRSDMSPRIRGRKHGGFGAAAAPAGIILNMTGHQNDSVKILALALALAVNVALCGLLIPMLGSIGAALATAATMTLWNGLMAIAVWRRLGIKAYVTFGFRRTM